MEDKTISHQTSFRRETKYGRWGGDSASKAWPRGKDKTKCSTGKSIYKNSKRINVSISETLSARKVSRMVKSVVPWKSDAPCTFITDIIFFLIHSIYENVELAKSLTAWTKGNRNHVRN